MAYSCCFFRLLAGTGEQTQGGWSGREARLCFCLYRGGLCVYIILKRHTSLTAPSHPFCLFPPLLHLNIFLLPPPPSRVCSPATPAVPRTLASALCTPSPLASLFQQPVGFSPFFFLICHRSYRRSREQHNPLRAPTTSSNLLSF